MFVKCDVFYYKTNNLHTQSKYTTIQAHFHMFRASTIILREQRQYLNLIKPVIYTVIKYVTLIIA
jgi:hypothetical protein